MAENKQALQPGTILESQSGKYKILKVLGQGGFGITYLVEGSIKVGNIVMKDRLALKEHFISSMSERVGNDVRVLDSNITVVKNSMKAFIREAERLQELGIEHPNIVKVNEVFMANNTAYYVMEYLDGETLESYVHRNVSLAEADALKFMQPIVQAIANLHANKLAHYDIKPQNIILRKGEGEQLVPTLIDFGLAKHYDEKGNQTSTTNVGGVSEGYSPTEQYAGIKQFSPQCDVYSLAATFVFCLTGRHPQNAFKLKIKEVEAELSGKLNPTTLQTLLKAYSKDSDDRHQSAEELYKDLYGEKPIVDIVDISGNVGKEKAKQTDVIGKKPTHESKTWGKIAAVAAAVVLLILAAIFLLPKGSDAAAAEEKDSDTIAQSVETPITPIISTPPIDEQEEVEEQEPVEEEVPKEEAPVVTPPTPTPKPTTGTINGHDWVDLGLPSGLKWATCNVGANSPSGYGNYYAWGETSTKSSYGGDNSKTRGEQMGNISGNSQYDAAKANWGSSWRLPTKAEFEELLNKNNCTWTWTTQGGHNGYKVTSKKNGNSIFLPAAGGRYGSSSDYVGSEGCYWSSTPNESFTSIAFELYFDSSVQDVYDTSYRDGQSVRPVSE